MSGKDCLFEHPKWPLLCTAVLNKNIDDLENLTMIEGVLRRHWLSVGCTFHIAPWAFMHC